MKIVKNGKIYDSNEEYVFECWLEDLKEAGYIHGYEYQPAAFELFDTVSYLIEIQGPKKTTKESKSLLRGKEYTCDYKIYWSQKSKNVFYQNLDEVKTKPPFFFAQNDISHVDVKGDFDTNGSHTLFEICRKWTWQKFGIFVNKTMPDGFEKCLFALTFTPSKYELNKKNCQPRKLHFVARTLNQFIETINKLEVF